MVTQGSGGKGKWWGKEVVTQRSDDEGKGGGDEGKWWWRKCWKMHCNGCMNVACSVLWGGSRSTKPCVFPCKVAAAGVQRYLVCVCAAVAAGVVLVPPLCSATSGCSCVPVCVVLCVSWICGCRSQWNGCMNVACPVLWGGSRSTKPWVSFKVAAAGDDSCLMCAAVAAGVVLVPPLCSATSGCSCSCVRSSMIFLNLWLQITLEWLHECCMLCVEGRKSEQETLCFSV